MRNPTGRPSYRRKREETFVEKKETFLEKEETFIEKEETFVEKGNEKFSKVGLCPSI
jgi:hypothetical protein